VTFSDNSQVHGLETGHGSAKPVPESGNFGGGKTNEDKGLPVTLGG